MSLIAAARSIGRPALGAAPLEQGAVEVADEPLGVGQLGELAEVGVAGGVERADAGGVDLGGQVEHEAVVALDDVERLDAAHRAVAGHDDVGLEAADPLERVERALAPIPSPRTASRR